MTTPEHTLVGILSTMALGLHTRFGARVVVFAAFASNVPDLDGVPMLFDMERFEAGHRVWGHNVLVILLTSILLASLQSRLGLIDRLIGVSGRFLPPSASPDATASEPPCPWLGLFVVSMLVQCLHIVCDIVVSGGHGLSDWHVLPLWPFHDASFVFPLIPWGDPGPTIIMMLGAIAIAKLGRSRLLAALTLIALAAYLGGRGLYRGTLSQFPLEEFQAVATSRVHSGH